MSKVKSYLSLIKFSHTIFAMPFALIGFFIGILSADYGVWNLNKALGWDWERPLSNPGFWEFYSGVLLTKFILVILCMVFARSAAMAFNRYLDRRFDAKNPRTAIREIPAGILKGTTPILHNY
jgi:4-hydroxybenzoate polyprenyltransferase